MVGFIQNCDHEFCELITCLRIPRDFAASIVRDARAHASRFRYYGSRITFYFPSLDKIIVKGRTKLMRDGIKAALRGWARNKALEVIFEE